LMQTCRRLQQILSVNRLSPAPAPLPLPLGTVHSGVRKSARRIAAAPFSSSTPGLPRTPARRLNATGIAPPPRRTNKRTRSSAFPVAPLPSSPLSAESENSDNDFHNLFTTPPRTKRPRLTTPPPPPNRGPRRHQVDDTDDEEDTQMEWTDEDDRQLVEMVLGKLRLSRTDWEECAQSLGKDSRSVGKRWENLLGNISIKNRKKKDATNLKRGGGSFDIRHSEYCFLSMGLLFGC